MNREKSPEFDLIERMTRELKVFSKHLRTGIGDDCAVIAKDDESDYLLTSDLLLEKVHFDRRWFLPEQIGSKALRASLSDIAAMGGRPEFALVGMAVPQIPDNTAEAVYQGIREAAEEFQVTLAGGDLSRSQEGIIIDVMLLGRVKKGQALLRSGALPGDRLYVSGTLGEAAMGLRALQAELSGSDAEPLIRRQKSPEPRLSLGHALCKDFRASAMIDLSDGLSSDLGHLCKKSGVGACIRMDALPVSESCRRICSQLSLDPLFCALHGGEDYELLFTVRPENLDQFRKQTLPVAVTEIGEILPASEGQWIELPDGRSEKIHPGGYDHFRQSP